MYTFDGVCSGQKQYPLVSHETLRTLGFFTLHTKTSSFTYIYIDLYSNSQFFSLLLWHLRDQVLHEKMGGTNKVAQFPLAFQALKT